MMDGFNSFTGPKVEIADDTVAFARNLFPNISLELIDKNYNTIAEIMLHTEACRQCFSVEQCPAKTGGYGPGVRLEPSGWMHLTYEPCRFKRGY